MAGGERITVLGQIRFLGRDITDLKPSKRARAGIVLCPERRRIFKESNVLENLRIGGYLASKSFRRQARELVAWSREAGRQLFAGLAVQGEL